MKMGDEPHSRNSNNSLKATCPSSPSVSQESFALPPPSNLEYDVLFPVTPHGLLLTIMMDGDGKTIFDSYRRMPDGRKGTAELTNCVRNVGNWIVAVNQVNTSNLPYYKVMSLLRACRNKKFAHGEQPAVLRPFHGIATQGRTEKTDDRTNAIDSHESLRAVTPPTIKRERSDDEEPARRVAQRIEPAKKLSEKEPMVKIVLEDLRSNDERTLEEAMKQLAQSTYDEDDARRAEKQNAFIEIGGHLAVSRAMKDHIDFKKVQRYGVRILQNSTYKKSSSRSAVAKVEGIHVTLAAMEKFPRRRNVIGNGFGAFCNMISGHETNADLLVKKIHAIPFLVERMAEFKHDEDVMLRACQMLNNVCYFHHLREMIVDAKVFSALASALESHRDNHHIQEAARAAMEQLMRDSNCFPFPQSK